VTAPRVVLVTTGSALGTGALTWPAWEQLRGGTVLLGAGHPLRPALVEAGVVVTDLPDGAGVEELADRLVAAAAPDRPAVHPVGVAPDPGLTGALDAAGADTTVLAGAPDPPGARLLEAVAVMDRLRSPGGCPWDAEQTHTSLAPYLLEECYEALEALETGDLHALRDELGDVLLQVLFHARLAEERPAGQGWTVDDVAAGLVAKLVRRHPHVFGDVAVSGAAEVTANWDEIKASEGPRGVVEGVAAGQPALSLGAKLQRRARRAGVPLGAGAEALGAAPSVAAALAALASALVDDDVPPTVDRVGELLFTAVSVAVDAGVDPEAALRGTARRFAARVTAAEALARAEGRDAARLGEGDWAELLARTAGPEPSADAAEDPVAAGGREVDDEGVPVELDADGAPLDLPPDAGARPAPGRGGAR